MSTPWASGDQTICEIPSRSHRGMTCASGGRTSIEYWGWLETQRSTPGSARDAFDLLDGPFAEADVAGLAGPDDLAERRDRLLQRRLGVEAVTLVEVDVVGLQTGERGIDLLVDLHGGQTLSVSDIGK